ncbi:MAG: MFS transporter, partial [Rhodoferax sp.]|nr:MFS transporter [Rhodoferax sp.]
SRAFDLFRLRRTGSEMGFQTRLGFRAGELWSVLRNLHDRRFRDLRYETILRFMRKAFPNFRELAIEQTGPTSVYASFIESNRAGPVWASGVSDGHLQLLILLTALFSEEEMTQWAWRIPFLIAGPLGLIGLYLRTQLEDTPEFRAVLATGKVVHAPIRSAVTGAWPALFFCVGFVVLKAVGHWTLQAFIPNYLTVHLHYSKLQAYGVTTLGLLTIALMVPWMGLLSDRFGRRPLMLLGCAGFFLLTYPAFLLMSQGHFGAAFAGMAILGVCIAAFDGACNAAMAELFPTRIRYGGMAVAYNISVAFFGGVTPYFALFLISATGDTLSPAYYVMLAAAITFATVLRAKETANQPLRSE